MIYIEKLLKIQWFVKLQWLFLKHKYLNLTYFKILVRYNVNIRVAYTHNKT